MAIQLQLRRGTEAENNTFMGAAGEVTVDTTNDTLRLHDGETLGGISIDKSVNVVHKAGNETINGEKTLTSNILLNSTIIDISLTPSTVEYFPQFYSHDKNNVLVSYCGAGRDTNNIIFNRFGVHRVINNVDHYAEIFVNMDTTGVVSTSAPTPGSTSSTSNTNIATTGWVNDATKSTNIVHKNTDETIAGTKTFSSSPVIPTPAVTDNSTKAATTAYVNAKLVIMNSIPSSGTNGVIYFTYS